MEVLQKDDQEEVRKEQRKKHQDMKKRLKRRWKKVKNKEVLMRAQAASKVNELDEEKLKLVETNLGVLKKMRNAENLDFKNKVEDLWVGKFSSVKDSCTRPIIGYLCEGGYSYRLGGSVGVGYVAWAAWTRRWEGRKV